MPYTRSRTGFGRQITMILVLPLAIMGTGYALFSQQLTINSQAAKPLYYSSQSMFATYNESSTVQGTSTAYTFNPVTITDRGIINMSAWQLQFDVPSDATQLTCDTTVVCTQNANTVTVTNGSTNGNIVAGGSATFTFSFASATPGYVLQNVYISGTYSSSYQTISGLTVGYTAGASSSKGANYTYPYSFTVTNNTGLNLGGWQAVCTWASAPSNFNIGTTVNYVTTANSITFSSTAALANAGSFTFTGSFGIKSSTWAITGCTVQGRG